MMRKNPLTYFAGAAALAVLLSACTGPNTVFNTSGPNPLISANDLRIELRHTRANVADPFNGYLYQYDLAWKFRWGETVDKNYLYAYAWFKMAAESARLQGNDKFQKKAIGSLQTTYKNSGRALRFSAEDGDALATQCLASNFSNCPGDAEIAEAIKYIREK